ncbi:MAG TPA: pyridoxal-phosphate dependent enzyme, partial [Ilumatobacter sp.]
MTDVDVTPDDVERASRRIEGLVRRTPVIDHGGLILKLELLQHAGSFKPRGAANRVLAERDRFGQLPPSGVITASGGNHGAAVAYVSHALGIAAEVFVPSM